MTTMPVLTMKNNRGNTEVFGQGACLNLRVSVEMALLAGLRRKFGHDDAEITHDFIICRIKPFLVPKTILSSIRPLFEN